MSFPEIYSHCTKMDDNDASGETNSAVRVAKDLIAGTAGGIAQVLVGQPFDIVKVRLQSSDAYSGSLNAVTRIASEEGLLAFYKGTLMPLMGIGVCVSLQFGFLEASKRAFRESNLTKGRSEQLSYPQLYMAGAIAGVGNSIASGPVEHIRIRLQTQTSSTGRYSGPIDALRKIHATDGFRGIYQGQVATVFREFHGYGMYFMAYEALVQRQCRMANCARGDISTLNSALFGAAAGYSMWLTSYPLDVIKSRIQTDGLPSQSLTRKYSGFLDCAAQLWRAQGAKGFFRGLTPTLIRSPFVNSATFVVFEQTMKLLG